MNLGQTMLVLAAMALLGIIVLTSNTSVLEMNQAQNESEAGLAAISLATSIVEEATGKMYDEAIANPSSGTISDPMSFTSPGSLGNDGSERYRGGMNDFNDCDDFNRLTLLYRNPSDGGNIPTGAEEVIVPGLRARYLVRTSVCYVSDTQLDRTATAQTWNKKITVVVTSPGNPAMPDSIVYATVISYWN